MHHGEVKLTLGGAGLQSAHEAHLMLHNLDRQPCKNMLLQYIALSAVLVGFSIYSQLKKKIRPF
jgi:hypothetical protein